MQTQLVIFDLDGTLLNTIADLAASANYALGALGFAARTEKECRAFVGNGVTKLLERSLPAGAKTSQNIEKMRPVFQAHYDLHNADFTTIYPGMASVLKTLADQGVKLAVASNKYQSATEKLVKHYFPGINFCAIYGARAGQPVKPDPKMVEDILALAQVERRNVWYVGDSDVDMQTARNAGLKVTAVLWGFRQKEQLLPFQPDAWAETAQDLLKIIR